MYVLLMIFIVYLMKFVHLDNVPGVSHLLKQKKTFTVSNSTIESMNVQYPSVVFESIAVLSCDFATAILCKHY